MFEQAHISSKLSFHQARVWWSSKYECQNSMSVWILSSLFKTTNKYLTFFLSFFTEDLASFSSFRYLSKNSTLHNSVGSANLMKSVRVIHPSLSANLATSSSKFGTTKLEKIYHKIHPSEINLNSCQFTVSDPPVLCWSIEVFLLAILK